MYTSSQHVTYAHQTRCISSLSPASPLNAMIPAAPRHRGEAYEYTPPDATVLAKHVEAGEGCKQSEPRRRPAPSSAESALGVLQCMFDGVRGHTIRTVANHWEFSGRNRCTCGPGSLVNTMSLGQQRRTYLGTMLSVSKYHVLACHHRRTVCSLNDGGQLGE